MLSEKEIQHIADLARINLTEKEREKFKNELSSILDYFNKLKQVNTDLVEPMSQVTDTTNLFREDKYRGDFKLDSDLYERLIDQAPHKENKFIKVKSVLNKN